MGDDYISASTYDDYISDIESSLSEASGSQQRALDAQLKSAKAAQKNAMEIAKLQASTSRYGIDVASKDRMRALLENARQFDAVHGLDIQKFDESKRQFGLTHGLDVAKAYTQYASTPDMMFARNDFVSALGRVGQGLGPDRAIDRTPGPRAKTWQDFAALAQYPGPGGAQSTQGAPGAPASGTGAGPEAAGGGTVSGGGMVQGPDGSWGPAPAPDPRLKAMRAVTEALPPSQAGGADDNDWAAINAITSLYKAGHPGSVARLGPARQKIALAGLARAGYDPGLVQEEYDRGLPGQGSVRRSSF